MAKLPEDYQALIAAALEARSRAYTPYSRFAVGAALLTADGTGFYGCNIENAAYPVTLCAERAALASAYALGKRDIVAIAVVADTPEPVSPCGMCRQALLELAPNAVVILANLRGEWRRTTPQELLPDGFSPLSLPR
jgi:cytidine deaminase